VADAARRSLEVVLARREDARARLGTDDPYILATVLRDYITDKAYEARQAKLDGIRLFPLDRRIIKEADLEFNQFPQILAYWRSKDGPFGSLVPKQWVGLYKGALENAGGQGQAGRAG
jgi:intracellular multiplication protein IcmJ